MMLLSATSNGVGVNVRLVGYGLSVSRYQGIYIDTQIHSNVVLINIIIFKLSSNATILKYFSLYVSSSLPLKTR